MINNDNLSSSIGRPSRRPKIDTSPSKSSKKSISSSVMWSIENVIQTAKSRKLVILHEPSSDMSNENPVIKGHNEYKDNFYLSERVKPTSFKHQSIKKSRQVNGIAKSNSKRCMKPKSKIKSGKSRRMPVWRDVRLGPSLNSNGYNSPTTPTCQIFHKLLQLNSTRSKCM